MLPTPTEAADRRKRKVTARDPFGRESGTWEEARRVTMLPSPSRRCPA